MARVDILAQLAARSDQTFSKAAEVKVVRVIPISTKGAEVNSLVAVAAAKRELDTSAVECEVDDILRELPAEEVYRVSTEVSQVLKKSIGVDLIAVQLPAQTRFDFDIRKPLREGCQHHGFRYIKHLERCSRVLNGSRVQVIRIVT